MNQVKSENKNECQKILEEEINYGIDAPAVVVSLLVLGFLLILLTYFLPKTLGMVSLILGNLLFLQGILMLLYARFGKFRHRDRMLSMLNWSGGEKVLDVGTGRGLLLIGAAQRLKNGLAIGIDIWRGKDLSGNEMKNTQENILLAQVSKTAKVESQDVQYLTFPDASFDYVLSNLVLHNIEEEQGQKMACQQIYRVLVPGGVALISDMKNISLYSSQFEKLGAKTQRFGPYFFTTFPPLAILRVEKPKPS